MNYPGPFLCKENTGKGAQALRVLIKVTMSQDFEKGVYYTWMPLEISQHTYSGLTTVSLLA